MVGWLPCSTPKEPRRSLSLRRTYSSASTSSSSIVKDVHRHLAKEGRVRQPNFSRSSLDDWSTNSESTLFSRNDNSPRLPSRGSFRSSENRAVRFTGDTDNKVSITVHEYEAVPTDLVEKVYWSRREIASIRAENKALARQLREERPELIDCIKYLHGQCQKNGVDLDEERAVQLLVESQGRGLEHFMTGVLCRHRRWSVQKVLAVQAQSIGEHPADIEALLRVWSFKASAAQRLLAFHMAMGDAASALGEGRPLPPIGRASRRASL